MGRTLTLSLTGPRGAGAGASKAATIALDLSEELLGRYEIGESLGKGGMGEVYRALDRTLKREVAIKFCVQYSNAQACARFMKEAAMMRRIDHPNVVGILDVGMVHEVPYLVMPLVIGQSLRHAIDDRKTIPVQEAVQILEQVLDALYAAHLAGVVHRDLKPDNVLLTEDGRAMVLDLGVAKSWADGSAAESNPQISGTPAYMPPEQCKGEPTGLSADLYAAGIILFEMLAGHPPFAGATALDVMKAHLTAKIPRVSDANPSLDPVWDDVVGRALAKSPVDRFPDAPAFKLALAKAAQGRFRIAGPMAARDLERRAGLGLDSGGPAAVLGMGIIGGLGATSAAELLAGNVYPAVAALLPLFSLFLQEEPGRFKQLAASLPYRMAVYVLTTLFTAMLIVMDVPDWINELMIAWIMMALHLAWFGGYHTRDPFDWKGVTLHRRLNILVMWMTTFIMRAASNPAATALSGAASIVALLCLVRRPARTRHLSVAAATTTILLPALGAAVPQAALAAAGASAGASATGVGSTGAVPASAGDTACLERDAGAKGSPRNGHARAGERRSEALRAPMRDRGSGSVIE